MLEALFSGLVKMAEASANNDAVMLQNQQKHETMRVQSQYQLAMAQEKTRQQKEETKRVIVEGVINGVFGVLAAAAASSANVNSNTNSNKKS